MPVLYREVHYFFRWHLQLTKVILNLKLLLNLLDFFASHLYLHIQYISFPFCIIISNNFQSQNQTYVIIHKGSQPLSPGY